EPIGIEAGELFQFTLAGEGVAGGDQYPIVASLVENQLAHGVQGTYAALTTGDQDGGTFVQSEVLARPGLRGWIFEGRHQRDTGDLDARRGYPLIFQGPCHTLMPHAVKMGSVAYPDPMRTVIRGHTNDGLGDDAFFDGAA